MSNITEQVYIFNDKEMQLKDIIPIIKVGDIIKGIDNYMAACSILSEINRQKNSNHSYLFDGPDQIILF